MSELLLSETDMKFLLFDWLKLEDDLTGTDFDRSMIDAYLDLSRKLAVEKFLPHYKTADINEPKLEDGRVHILPEVGEALSQYRELGLFGASFPEALGGMGLPHAVVSASYAWFAAANCSTIGYAMLTGANARLIAAFGNEQQVETFARPQIAGNWFGTMCLSEPQAGSSLGDIRTSARPAGEDEHGFRYLLTGNKMWISGGDQDISENIVHLVLAKIPLEDGTLPEGTAGISLFIVPKILPNGDTNDIAVAGLNHKMGNRGTSNCLLNFGENGGAAGWIIGEPGQGLRQMFMMMNEARIAVGFGAASLACRGYLLAAEYARERLQGRASGVRGGLPIPIIEHIDVRRMLLAARSYGEGAMALCLLSSILVDRSDKPEDRALLELLTPVTKTFASEYGLKANDLAIQIHGGYGYTRDFDVEQLYRDNRLNPIHEGTSGIQAADLLGRKILQDDSGLGELAKRISATCVTASKDAELLPQARAVQDAWRCIETTLQNVRRQARERQLDHAANFLTAFSLVVVSWIWLDKAIAVSSLDPLNGEVRLLREGKRITCRYFIEFELPAAMPLLAKVAEGSDLISDLCSQVL